MAWRGFCRSCGEVRCIVPPRTIDAASADMDFRCATCDSPNLDMATLVDGGETEMADVKQVTLTLDIRGVPEVIAEVQARLRRLLQEEADAQADPRVARALRKVAADFEVGLGG